MTCKVRFTLTMPIKLSASLEKMASEKGVSKNAMMLQILWKHIEVTDKEGHPCQTG